ncbi:hypothetical protein CI102_3572 [Trichoderma harzianum]|nr:hypothetical protein CI102_3572 [Trichoderma harzianum]
MYQWQSDTPADTTSVSRSHSRDNPIQIPVLRVRIRKNIHTPSQIRSVASSLYWPVRLGHLLVSSSLISHPWMIVIVNTLGAIWLFDQCSRYHWYSILISSPAAPKLSLSCPLLITSVVILAIIPPFPP